MGAGPVVSSTRSLSPPTQPTPHHLITPPPSPPPHHHHRAALLKAEEEWIAATCATIVAHKPDLVITEKGLSDLAAHFLTKVWA